MKTKLPKATVLVLFVLIVAMSGCLGSTQCPIVASQTEGLVVDRFAPSYNLIPVGDRIILDMEIINRGTMPAENVEATLWTHSGFTISSKSSETIVLDRPLQPPDMSICSPGDAKSIQWLLCAGCDPTETTFSVYLDYDYTSEGYATILLASHAEASKVAGQFAGERGENFPSAGPIQVQIEPLQTEPIIVSDFSPNFDIRIIFKNVGTGLAGENSFGDLGTTTLTVQGPCVFTDCTGGRETCNSFTWSERDVKLRAGDQEALKVASMKFDGDYDTFIKDVCRVNVESKYKYRSVIATEKKIGVTGSNSQVLSCRQNPEKTACD